MRDLPMMNKVILTMLCLALAACSAQPSGPVSPRVKVGKPYVIEGKTYYPAQDHSYDKTGDASWYGPGFHGKYTANGEIFNQDDMTAAHPTLPMPSIVRVTNLENGRSIILRINDRGPFKKNRIIDLSKKSAETLGVHSISKVRVQYLKRESEDYIAALENGRVIDMAHYNGDAPSPQIVEQTVAASEAGQAVNNAAPVLSVGSGNLGTPGGPVRLVSDAVAEEIEPQAPAAPLVQQKELSPSAAPPATGGYAIQAGSFSSEENARKLAGRLEAYGPVMTESVEAGGRNWWRVRVGPFAARSDAETRLAQVQSSGAPDARVVKQ